MLEIVLEILKFTIPALIVALTVYIMLHLHTSKEKQLKLLELKSKYSKETLPLQLQAYERLALLISRIAPEQLLIRLKNPNLKVNDMRNLLIQSIKQETEHNVTQQIYVSNSVWNAIMGFQQELMSVINTSAKELDPNESGLKLSEKVLEYYIEHPEVINSTKIMDILKSDVKLLMR